MMHINAIKILNELFIYLKTIEYEQREDLIVAYKKKKFFF